MAGKYASIPAVGQMDPTACWAACLSWWLKAVQNTIKSQQEIFSLFVGQGEKQICSSDGQIYPEILREKLGKNYPLFKMLTHDVIPAKLADWLEQGDAVMIGFTTSGGTGHMNVIYDFDPKASTVQAMEPWFPDLKTTRSGGAIFLDDGAKFTGTHASRNLKYYTPLTSGYLFIGCNFGIAKVGPGQSSGSGIVSAKSWF